MLFFSRPTSQSVRKVTHSVDLTEGSVTKQLRNCSSVSRRWPSAHSEQDGHRGGQAEGGVRWGPRAPHLQEMTRHRGAPRGERVQVTAFRAHATARVAARSTASSCMSRGTTVLLDGPVLQSSAGCES